MGSSTPAIIRYELPDGCAAEELCYWRDMTFGPHCWHVLGLRGFSVDLSFGPPLPPAADRKALAASLHGEISNLHAEPAPAAITLVTPYPGHRVPMGI